MSALAIALIVFGLACLLATGIVWACVRVGALADRRFDEDNRHFGDGQ